MNEDRENHRPIRSYVLRQGRLTAAQQRALDQLLPVYGLDPAQGSLHLDHAFGRNAPRFVEIGFGNGEALAGLARDHPECDYLGVEVHRPGVGRLLLTLEREGLTNVRVVCGDGTDVLRRMIPDESLDGIYLFFPDPWHKKRHHKRRIIQPSFAELARRRLKPRGVIHLATDWADYAEHMMAVMTATPGFTNAAGQGRFSERGDRPLTKYEARGQRLGHRVWDLVFVRKREHAPG